jgi:hypothetical protein
VAAVPAAAVAAAGVAAGTRLIECNCARRAHP